MCHIWERQETVRLLDGEETNVEELRRCIDSLQKNQLCARPTAGRRQSPKNNGTPVKDETQRMRNESIAFINVLIAKRHVCAETLQHLEIHVHDIGDHFMVDGSLTAQQIEHLSEHTRKLRNMSLTQQDHTSTSPARPPVKRTILRTEAMAERRGWQVGANKFLWDEKSPAVTPVATTRGMLGRSAKNEVEEVSMPGSEVVMARKRIFIDRGKQAAARDRKQIQSEVNNLRSLYHEHIVKVLGCYAEQMGKRQTFCVLMFPAAEEDLEHFLCEQCKPASVEQKSWIATWFGCLASALAYMQSQGVFHEDIKPSNIVHCGQHVYFTDFGSSRRLEADQDTSTDTPALASKMFAAPEAMPEDGNLLGHGSKTDVYSLGLVFVEMQATYTGVDVTQMREFFFGKHTQARWYRQVTPQLAGYLGQSHIWQACIANMLHPIRQLRPSAQDVVNILAHERFQKFFNDCACRSTRTADAPTPIGLRRGQSYVNPRTTIPPDRPPHSTDTLPASGRNQLRRVQTAAAAVGLQITIQGPPPILITPNGQPYPDESAIEDESSDYNDEPPTRARRARRNHTDKVRKAQVQRLPPFVHQYHQSDLPPPNIYALPHPFPSAPPVSISRYTPTPPAPQLAFDPRHNYPAYSISPPSKTSGYHTMGALIQPAQSNRRPRRAPPSYRQHEPPREAEALHNHQLPRYTSTPPPQRARRKNLPSQDEHNSDNEAQLTRPSSRKAERDPWDSRHDQKPSVEQKPSRHQIPIDKTAPPPPPPPPPDTHAYPPSAKDKAKHPPTFPSTSTLTHRQKPKSARTITQSPSTTSPRPAIPAQTPKKVSFEFDVDGPSTTKT